MKKPYPEAFSLNGLILLGLLAALVWWIYVRFDNHNWPETNGRIVESWIEEHQDTDNDNQSYDTHYTICYKFIYLVNKQSHEGQGGSPYTYETNLEAQRVQKEQFYKGNHIRVLYNPNNPAESNLYRHPF